MVCQHWIKQVIEIENNETGEVRKLTRIIPNNMPYHLAVHNLEHFISKIVTANFRKSWLFNNFLNHSWFTPHYWKLKAFVFRSDEVIY